MQTATVSDRKDRATRRRWLACNNPRQVGHKLEQEPSGQEAQHGAKYDVKVTRVDELVKRCPKLHDGCVQNAELWVNVFIVEYKHLLTHSYQALFTKAAADFTLPARCKAVQFLAGVDPCQPAIAIVCMDYVLRTPCLAPRAKYQS